MKNDKKNDKKNDEGTDSQQRLSETLRKVLSAGIGAAFMTEEHIRTYVGELKLPKEVVTSLLQGANRSKEELLERVGNEVIKIISRIDFVEEASRFVENHKFRVSAEIEVIKKEGSSDSSEITTKVNIVDKV